MQIQGDKPMSWRYLKKPDVITDEMVVATLRAVVAERPDYVYRRPEHMLPLVDGEGETEADCFYVHTAPDDVDELTPGCLVGTVLYRLGVPLEVLEEWEGSGGYEVTSEFGASRTACSLMSEVQSTQDGGQPWRVALERAEERYPEVFGPC